MCIRDRCSLLNKNLEAFGDFDVNLQKVISQLSESSIHTIMKDFFASETELFEQLTKESYFRYKDTVESYSFNVTKSLELLVKELGQQLKDLSKFCSHNI
eukprot:TRINITY_DN127_c0_g1_i1.p1 TRINITY_DN127_c0_g1~~TRINITY_DN127_c0_g1_i1.p1  ORF type:complete len:100 (-),score=22.69 TRINITY_DN127_c0_g1_i1:90-389(-)